MLKDLLEQLDTGETDMDLTGYTAEVIESLMLQEHQDGEADAEPQVDRAAELAEKWGVKTGDLWLIGEHRLLCGDSTKADDVERVMGGEKAALCLTDPPYGLGDSVTDKNKYATHDDSIQNLRKLISGVIVPIIGQMRVVFTPGNKNHYEYPIPSWTMAWFCPAGVGCGPWGFCCWQPILCYGKDPKLATGKGSHPDALVHQESPSSDQHPCAKPMKLWIWLLDRVSNIGELVYDPFLGSGTTMVAAQNLKRKCYGIEISTVYVGVILQRMADSFPGIEIRKSDA
jgi:DNA modification methylase